VPYSVRALSVYLYVLTATTVPVPVFGLNPVSHGPPLSPAVIPQATAAVLSEPVLPEAALPEPVLPEAPPSDARPAQKSGYWPPNGGSLGYPNT
jgi:hypothetical protein